MEPQHYRQLIPPGPAINALAYVDQLDLQHPNRDRPYVLANFVASLDGHVTIGEHSRGLSAQADRELFYALRERVDAVLVGPNTLQAERYKRMLPQAERRERRAATGRAPEPLAVTITRSGNLNRDIPLFIETPDNVLVFDAAKADLSAALRTLRNDHGVETLLCEGGPTLFGALLQADLVDELHLTLAPMLTGGTSGPAVVSGPPPETPTNLRLAAALEHDGTLFLRYRIG